MMVSLKRGSRDEAGKNILGKREMLTIISATATSIAWWIFLDSNRQILFAEIA